MTTSLDFAEIQRRPLKYWNADGLPELMMGLLWMIWGAAWLVGEALPRGPVWNIYWTLTPALLALSGMASVWATKKLKERITFPRGGYVDWKEPSRTRRVMAGATAIVAAAVIVVLITGAREHGTERVVPMVMGVLLSLGFLVASVTQRAPHMLALAGVALMLGLSFGALNLGWQSTNWMLLALGTVSLLVGAMRLSLFLKRHSLPEGA